MKTLARIVTVLVLASTCFCASAQDTKVRNVAIFIHEGVELLDFAGPGEVFASAGRDFNVYTVAPSKKPLVSQRFLTLTPQYSLEDCPKPDIIIIPGGDTQRPMGDPQVIAWIKSAGKDAEYILTVCTGALLLAKAGFLDGKTATTHYCCQDMLANEFPNVKVVKGKRWIDNGTIITTEGISAGIDGSLYLLSRLKGMERAERVARYMMYNWNLKDLDFTVIN